MSVISFLPASHLQAQHHPPAARPPAQPDTAAPRARMGMQHGVMMAPGPLGISPAREGSGTSWLPDESPMYAHHAQAGRWQLMLHYNAFLQYIDESGDRGDSQFGSINWVMGMATRPLAGGDIRIRAMMSAELFTVGRCGYPDLLATGEFCNGEPLHDRQHPHDLFMDLSAGYERALTRGLAFQLHGGPVGEPALGPVAYPHRTSALPNPIAPIAHHWMDPTHISFGVVTAGVFGRRWKLEGSAFNGREPDEDRYDFDLAALDSYSGRLSLLPAERWSLQVSVGRLNDAEPAHEAGEGPRDITRPTASVIYHRPVGQGSSWASTLVWGRNIEAGHSTDAFLLESSLDLGERNTFFGRAELVRKPGEDLVLSDHRLEAETFTVGKVQLGYARQFRPLGGLVPGVGASVAVNFLPAALEPFYGSGAPAGFAVWASFRPARMRMDPMAMDGMGRGAMPEAEHPRHQPATPAAPDSARADSMRGGQGMMHGRRMESTNEEQLRLMHEIHMRMMADPVIRERVATDPVLLRMMQRMHEMMGDTAAARAGHAMNGAAADAAEAREAMEFITLLLSDSQIEARVHADPKLHRLWSDPEVQRCLEAMRRLKASGQPLPAACPAGPPATGKHPSH